MYPLLYMYIICYIYSTKVVLVSQPYLGCFFTTEAKSEHFHFCVTVFPYLLP